MPDRVGSVSEFSETTCFEWRIPDFSKLVAAANKRFYSPVFSFSGCTWYLDFHSIDYETGERLSLRLWRKDSRDVVKTVTCTLSVKKSDGTLEEQESNKMTFKKKSSHHLSSRYLFSLKKLLKRKSELIPSDTLTFKCRLENNVTSGQPLVTSKLTQLETLSNDFSDLFMYNKKCDVTIQVKDKAFQTHKAILVARSPVFAAMFEHDSLEEKRGVVIVPDCDPDSFGDFLQYLYSGKLEGLSFRNARHLYVIADKYDVQELKSFCATYMHRNLNVGNMFDVVILADHYVDTGLLSSAQNFFNQNFHEIISTDQWESTVKNNFRLANKLLMNIPNLNPKKLILNIKKSN